MRRSGSTRRCDVRWQIRFLATFHKIAPRNCSHSCESWPCLAYSTQTRLKAQYSILRNLLGFDNSILRNLGNLLAFDNSILRNLGFASPILRNLGFELRSSLIINSDNPSFVGALNPLLFSASFQTIPLIFKVDDGSDYCHPHLWNHQRPLGYRKCCLQYRRRYLQLWRDLRWYPLRCLP